MKLCKICNKEIADTKRWIYCSDECVAENKKIKNSISKDIAKQKHIKEKENWNYVVIEMGKVKHNRKIPINKLEITNGVKTHLKFMLKEYNLTSKKDIKIKRNDGVTKSYSFVVVTPKMIETMFYKRYETYKQNFRMDSLKSVKTLEKVFNIANDYYSKANDEKMG